MDRKSLKQRGKAAFKANYWKAVFATLLLALSVGGFTGATGSSVDLDFDETYDTGSSYQYAIDPSLPYDDIDNPPISVVETPAQEASASSYAASLARSLEESAPVIASVGAISGLISIFFLAPLEIGCRSFLRKNLHAPADLEDMKDGFVPKYFRNVATQFLASLFISIGFIFLLIPGIILSYMFAMVPYILAEDDDIGVMDAIRRSKALTAGHKWDLFVLDLSFFGWILLDVLTLGILGIFYVNPYLYSTHAAYYEELKRLQGAAPAPENTPAIEA